MGRENFGAKPQWNNQPKNIQMRIQVTTINYQKYLKLGKFIKVSVTESIYKILIFSFFSPFDEIKGEFSNGEFFMFFFLGKFIYFR